MQHFIRRAACLLIAIVLVLGGAPAFETVALAAPSGMVRVHLTKLGTLSSLSMTTTCEYYVGADKSQKIASGSAVKVSLSGGSLNLSVNGGSAKSMGSKLTLSRGRTGNCGIKFTSPSQSNLFCGDLQLSITSGSIKPVLSIFIEDYLYGVIGYEMSDEYQMEALKAQAVASRCLAIGNQKTTGTHDVTDNTYSQVFKGLNPKLTNVIKAVDATKGVTAYYNNKVAILYYADSNGGQIEATKNVWGNTLGYSVVKDDPYDLEYPKASVKRLTLPKKPSGANPLNSKLNTALIAALASDLKAKGLKTGTSNVTIVEIKAIEGIDPKYPAPSRNWTKLRFTCAVKAVDASSGANKTATVTGSLETYGYLKNNYSLALQSTNIELFTAADNGATWSIESRRWGHGIGMSQCGAQWMAKQYGKGYRDILAFYFPGIELRTISYQDLTMNAPDPGPTAPPIVPEPNPDEGSVDRPAELKLLKMGSKGSDVLQLQKRLLALGFFGGSPAGNFGAQTQTAVKKFQSKWKLTASGQAEPELQRLIYAQNAPKTGTAASPLMLTISVPSGSKTVAMRASASSSAKVLKKLGEGKSIRVLSISGKWCKISVSGKSGYVAKKYIHFP